MSLLSAAVFHLSTWSSPEVGSHSGTNQVLLGSFRRVYSPMLSSFFSLFQVGRTPSADGGAATYWYGRVEFRRPSVFLVSFKGKKSLQMRRSSGHAGLQVARGRVCALW